MQPAPGWDVGELPTVRMAFMEYPAYAPHRLSQRDHDTTRTATTRNAELLAEQRRQQTRSETGWASSRRGAYRPLGTPDLTLPSTGDELRRIKEATSERTKPRVVKPDERKKASRAREEDEIEKLELDQPLRASVRQFCYAYYEVWLRERSNLRITVKTLSGDPDIFVSTDNMFPTIDDHVWRSGGKGDDMVLIETDHPRYINGPYHIGIYAICDSEFELSATLAEVHLSESMKLFDGTTGNGYGTLSQLVSQAEERRRLCSFGAPALVKPAAKDTAALFLSLPPHLKTELSPALLAPAPAAANVTASPSPPTGAGDGEASPAASPRRRTAGSNTGGAASPSPRSMAGAEDNVAEDAAKGDGIAAGKKPPPAPLSVLLTPYLATAYFGTGLTPRLGGPKRDADCAVAATQAALPPGGAIDRSLLASHLSNAPPPAPAPSPSVHPWLPGAAEASVLSEVEEVTARASTDLAPLIMQLKHTAMKEDMNAQMCRVARAIEAERALILGVKHTALENALRSAQGKVARGEGLPLAENPTDSLRAMRSQANGMREALLQQLREVAEAEVFRQQQSTLLRPRASPRGAPLTKGGAAASAAHRGGANKNRGSMRASVQEAGGGTTAAESARGTDGVAKRRMGRKMSRTSPGRMSQVRAGEAAGEGAAGGALPLLPLTARARLPGGAAAGSAADTAAAAAGAADIDTNRLSTSYPVCLPLLQPSSTARRVAEPTSAVGGHAISAVAALPREAAAMGGAITRAAVGMGAHAATAAQLEDESAPHSFGGGGLDAMFDFEELVPPPMEFALSAPHPPEGSKPLGLTPRAAARKAAPASVQQLPRPSGSDASDNGGYGKLAIRTHVKKTKQPARVWSSQNTANAHSAMNVPAPLSK